MEGSSSNDMYYQFSNNANNNNSSLSDDDESSELELLILLNLYEEEQQQWIARQPCRDSALTGCQWVEEILVGHHMRLFENCRMDVNIFLRFCHILREGGYIDDNPHRHVSVEEAVCLFLILVSHDQRQRVLAERFQHSLETINRNVRRVVRAIVALGTVVIRPRNDENIHPRILNNSKYFPWFQDCIGAIDGTTVFAWVPVHRRDAFRSRKTEISQNVLAICDHDMRFIFIHAGWEGSAHDARVFADSCMTPENNFPFSPQGKYYVVDSAYKNAPGFLAPYRGQRYHLRDYRGSGRGPRSWKELFNHRHSSVRNIIERTFGVLKKRFPLLKCPMQNYMLARQTSLVIACCVVPNFIKEQLPYDAYFLEHSDEDFIVDHEGLPMNPHFNISNERVDEWNQYRNDIAMHMWNYGK